MWCHVGVSLLELGCPCVVDAYPGGTWLGECAAFDVVDDDPRKREMGRLVNSRYQWYVAINSSSENIKNQCRRSDDAATEQSK